MFRYHVCFPFCHKTVSNQNRFLLIYDCDWSVHYIIIYMWIFLNLNYHPQHIIYLYVISASKNLKNCEKNSWITSCVKFIRQAKSNLFLSVGSIWWWPRSCLICGNAMKIFIKNKSCCSWYLVFIFHSDPLMKNTRDIVFEVIMTFYVFTFCLIDKLCRIFSSGDERQIRRTTLS